MRHQKLWCKSGLSGWNQFIRRRVHVQCFCHHTPFPPKVKRRYCNIWPNVKPFQTCLTSFYGILCSRSLRPHWDPSPPQGPADENQTCSKKIEISNFFAADRMNSTKKPKLRLSNAARKRNATNFLIFSKLLQYLDLCFVYIKADIFHGVGQFVSRDKTVSVLKHQISATIANPNLSKMISHHVKI